MNINSTKSLSIKKAAVALLLIGAGVLLVLFENGLFPAHIKPYIFSWPSLLLALGIVNLCSRESVVTGIVLTLGGLFFWSVKFLGNAVPLTSYLVPMALILAGVAVFAKRHRKFKHCGPSSCESPQDAKIDNSSYINEVNILGGAKKKFEGKSFTGGKIVNIFSGVELDFTACPMDGSEVSLEMVNIFGGANLIVPENWKVRIEAVSIFGGVVDKTSHACAPTENTIRIKGVNIFGGTEIKNLR